MRKSFKTYLLSIVMMAAFVSTNLLSGCVTEPAESQQESVRAMLTAHPWKIKIFTVDGVAGAATMYENLQVTFDNTSWSATGKGGKIWPAAGGTWEFGDEAAQIIHRSDGTVIEINSIKFEELVLKLNWASTTLETGRSFSVKGEHMFTFTNP